MRVMCITGDYNIMTALSRPLSIFFQMVSGKEFIGRAAAAVETVRAYPAFRQPDTLHKIFESAEFQRRQSEPASYLIHHSLIFRGARRGVTFKILILISLEVLDDAAGYQLQITLR